MILDRSLQPFVAITSIYRAPKTDFLDYNSLAKVDFVFGISKGNVYEAHRGGIDKSLYEKASLKTCHN